MTKEEVRPLAALLKLLQGAWLTQAVHAAATLGIADAPDAGPLPVDELARRVETDPRSTARLLRVLAMAGVFR